jgi:hypothetical protein
MNDADYLSESESVSFPRLEEICFFFLKVALKNKP